VLATRSASDVVMGCDAINAWIDDNTRLKEAATGSNGRLRSRHMDGLNVAYVDGHVKWQKIETLKYGQFVWSATATSSPPESTPLPLP